MPVDERAKDTSTGDYIVIRALENGVNLIGMTRGRDTRLLHTEKLDKGEVIIGRNPDPARQDSFRPG